jgi:hypothetical protein
MTTLELACAIADAVSIALRPAGNDRNRSENLTEDGPTQALLRVLHETGHAFCRLEDTPQGTVEVQMEMFQR